MELNIFMRELESALIKRGIPDETAVKHVSNLRRTFTSDDLSEIKAIQTRDEIDELADSISLILNKNRKSVQNQQKRPPSAVQPIQQISNDESLPKQVRQHRSDIVPRENKSAVRQNDIKQSSKDLSDDYYDEYSVNEKATVKGMTVFWAGLVLTLPVSLAFLAIIFGAFISVFAALIALIIIGVAGLIALVAAGTGVSLIGIIFGITQLFSFAAAGIYEIGLGVMVAGAVLFISVLIYNFAIRFLPWIISRVGTLLGFVCGKLKTLFLCVRRECYKL